MNIDLSAKDIVKKFGALTAVNNISFDVPKGSFFSILGPSGCGKTTLLRMIAGFDHPTSGSLKICGRDMLGIAPNKRPVNLVFQHLALFPMMNVSENIAFGLHRRSVDKQTIQKKVHEILERVGLPEYANKRIDQLSGGQKQRIAIARCLVLDPTVLLLDEPLGALDLKLREQMKVELKKLQSEVGTTFIYITHDQSEALVMSDSVAVMQNGVFEQIASPRELYAEPATSFVASFVGDNNTWSATVSGIENDCIAVETDSNLHFKTRSKDNVSIGQKVDLFLRPEAIVINPHDVSGLNLLQVTVKAVLFDGANSRLLTVTKAGRELTVSLPQNRQYDYIQKGDRISLGWSPESGICFKRED